MSREIESYAQSVSDDLNNRWLKSQLLSIMDWVNLHHDKKMIPDWMKSKKRKDKEEIDRVRLVKYVREYHEKRVDRLTADRDNSEYEKGMIGYIEFDRGIEGSIRIIEALDKYFL